ncbi:MAG: hypothetical protein [Bacteriophage sp.]|nr:MAG: hypothetical protein [Bacteriophage sp.]
MIDFILNYGGIFVLSFIVGYLASAYWDWRVRNKNG